jgi:hypothetical protein
VNADNDSHPLVHDVVGSRNSGRGLRRHRRDHVREHVAVGGQADAIKGQVRECFGQWPQLGVEVGR